MEFLELIAMLGLTVVLPITIVKLALKYKKEKLEAERGGQGLTVSELKQLLVDAVREANAPLLQRMEELEAGRDGLPPSGGRDLFVGVEDEVDTGGEVVGEDVGAGKTVGRRVHG